MDRKSKHKKTETENLIIELKAAEAKSNKKKQSEYYLLKIFHENLFEVSGHERLI